MSKFFFVISETLLKRCFRNPKVKFLLIISIVSKVVTKVFSWKVVAKVFSDTKIKFCKLCLTEKVFIINALNDSQLLNKKSELISTCRHQNELSLKYLKRNNKKHDSMDEKLNG